MASTLSDITIRTSFKPGDLGTIIHLHGLLYATEHAWGVGFESYVAEGLAEFYKQYDADRSHIWIAEDTGKIVGCVALLDRGHEAQLRYYLVVPEYRGMGLGRRLMEHFMSFLIEHGYKSAYLWTTQNLEVAAQVYTKYGFELTEKKSSVAFGSTVEEQKYEWHQR